MSTEERLDGAYEAARMYYDEGWTMEAVAGSLGVSRSTVSRPLRDARDADIVRISLHPRACGAWPISRGRSSAASASTPAW